MDKGKDFIDETMDNLVKVAFNMFSLIAANGSVPMHILIRDFGERVIAVADKFKEEGNDTAVY